MTLDIKDIKYIKINLLPKEFENNPLLKDIKAIQEMQKILQMSPEEKRKNKNIKIETSLGTIELGAISQNYDSKKIHFAAPIQVVDEYDIMKFLDEKIQERLKVINYRLNHGEDKLRVKILDILELVDSGSEVIDTINLKSKSCDSFDL